MKQSAPIGKKFGRLTVIGEVHRPHPTHSRWDWVCRCDCGTEITNIPCVLKSGRAKSCGCLHRELSFQLRYRHGRTKSYLYVAWRGMRRRCQNPNDRHYSSYGGRGITVCERWLTFENFMSDMGERPSPKHSLDRWDNNRGYSPDNCRWATKKEQQYNTRRAARRRLNDAIKRMKKMDIDFSSDDVMSKLHGLRIRNPGNIAVTNRITTVMGLLEVVQQPEGREGHHADAMRILARASAELGPLLMKGVE